MSKLAAAAMILTVFYGAVTRGADVPEVAKTLLEQKKAPPLPKPTGPVVRVTNTAELERAVAKLQSGQTVLIAPGTYKPRRDLSVGMANRGGKPLRGIAIRGETGTRGDVIIRGPGKENRKGTPRNGFQLYNVHGALLADLSVGDYFHHPIKCNGRDGCRGVRMYNLRLFDAGEQFVKGSTVRNCVVEHCLIEYTAIGPIANDGYTQGVDFHAARNTVVRDCIFRNMHVKPGLRHQYGPAVLMWSGSRDTLVERNVFLDCDRGVAFGLTPTRGHVGGMIRNNFFYTSKRITNADCPIIVWNSPGTRVLHNTILTNGTYRNAIEYRFRQTKGVVIANNVTDAPITARSGARAAVYGNYTNATPDLFVDAAGCDLHLKEHAAAIVGKAADLKTPLDVSDCADDFDGHPRPTETPRDLGADQVNSRPRPAAKLRPAVQAFVLPRRTDELTFPVKTFQATGKVTGYRITKTPIPPAASAEGWSAAPPASVTETEPGVYDYYAWVKDAGREVSLYAAQTVEVKTTRITVGPKNRDFTNFADAIAAIAERGNPKGCLIEADAGEYPSWRPQNEYKGKPAFLKNIIKVRADNLTIRGVGGRAHLAYKCRGPDTKRRWTVPPRGTQHGSVIVQAARNLRLENIGVSGGCEATSGNGAGLWVEPAGVGAVIRNCYFHHNDNGILTSRIPGSRVVILNSEFHMNGSPGPFPEGQNHNLYIGEVDELVFLFNFSHASYRGQLLKSRAGKNYVLYNKLIDEKKSNYPIDLPYGGESYVIGNLVQKSKTACNSTFINYGREMVMDIVYRNGGPEPLKDRMTVTNQRTGRSYKLRYNFNYGAKGTWKGRDRASHCNMRITEADRPDFKPGDKLTYGTHSSIEVAKAAWKWSSPRREIYVYSNTFVNYDAQGYGQYLLRAHIDTEVARVRNNLIIDVKPPESWTKSRPFPYKLHLDVSNRVKEKPVTGSDNCWETSDPGLADMAGGDYSLAKPAADVVDKGAAPGSVNGMDLRPRYEYVHPCSGKPRASDGKLDIGAYEFIPPRKTPKPAPDPG
jgi:hypothetical protein